MNRYLYALLIAPLIQAATPRPNAPTAVCPETEYVEMSRLSLLPDREICVSPGILTGIIFDMAVEVELQEELRFMNVVQGRNEIIFRPPRDLAAGERLRLTAKLGKGESRQDITFLLVAHPGNATHQVEVYHDTRPRDSILQEAAEEHAKNQQLREDNQRLHSQVEEVQTSLHRFAGLTGAYLSGTLSTYGIQTVNLPSSEPSAALVASTVHSYRSRTNIAIEATVHNHSAESWTAIGVSLSNSKGQKLSGLIVSRAETIAPNDESTVFMEASANLAEFHETYTLTLLENGPRTVTLPQVIFPD